MCNASWQMLAQCAWQGGYLLVMTVQRGELQGCSGGGGDACLDHGSSILPCQRCPLQAPLCFTSRSLSAKSRSFADWLVITAAAVSGAVGCWAEPGWTWSG